MTVKKLLTHMMVAAVALSGFAASIAPTHTKAMVISEQAQPTARYMVGTKAGTQGIEDAILQLGGSIVDEWTFINTYLVEIDPAKAPSIQSVPGVVFVNQDEKVVENKKSSKTSDDKLIANVYQSVLASDKVVKKGVTGKGVTVAVVDSGIANGAQSDFKKRVSANAKFSTANNMSDSFGHGTHVASILGGDGTQSNGAYPGVAPGVDIVNVKVSDDEGKAGEQNLVEGLEWIYDNHEKYNIRVVNISNQIATQQNYKESATNAAVELLWHKGIVVVVSAGNQGGTSCSTCYAPANDPFVITVGSIDDKGTKDTADDSLKNWSSNGLTSEGFSKPEVVAPGSKITAYMPKGELRGLKPENVVSNDYFTMGGTSMSTPMVSGIVALMLEQNPNLTPDQVKWILKNTTRSYGKQPAGSAGLVTADAAVFFKPSNLPANVTQNFELSSLIAAAAGDDVNLDTPDSWSNIAWRNVSWSNIAWRNIAWRNNFD
ncbi:intracellular alkaline serine proteinase [Planococcus donghaensis MPA1U2]|uniref:Intracellular alkaline serine proteinase n=1 Tax=Planococcus donghaensis MPA1U2 TaxID=933115 RepID=E7RKL7_9BACL|nr:S8 family peptidase [Planococcus donghaensis]EGA88447.1 intracellular alkaline serine proteinase [Planococcus donghaensis MPA1U2]